MVHIPEDEQLTVTIGERVRLRCLASRLPKTVIAGLAGISPDYLYQIERGLKLPTVTVLMQLAEVLDVSADELLRPPQSALHRFKHAHRVTRCTGRSRDRRRPMAWPWM